MLHQLHARIADTSLFTIGDDPNEPLFELFRILQLKPLGTEESLHLWQAVTGERRNATQMRPLEILTGGSPRLVAIVAEFGRHRTMPRLLEELVGLVDDHTEYFRGNLDSLPRTERRVYAALCDLWRPSTTREVAKSARSEVRKTSALLGRLIGRGAVRADGEGRNRLLYSVAEPLHSIHYKLRRWRDEAEVAGFDEVVARFGDSAEADIQECVAAALLNRGFLLGRLGEREAAIASYDTAIGRFGDSSHPRLRLSVAMALREKAPRRPTWSHPNRWTLRWRSGTT